MKVKSSLYWATLFLAISLIQGCTPKRQVHGYMPLASQLAQLQPGVSSKADVVQLLGTPAFINSFADNRWHYVAYSTKQVGFLEPEIVQYDVLQLIFDERQQLKVIRRGDKNTLVALTHQKDFTPSSGREMTVLEQLLGNIGRFEE